MILKKNFAQLTTAFAIHPGEILLDELKDRNIKQIEFAQGIDYSATQLNEFINGKRNITPELALLIGTKLSMNPLIWMNLQAKYDLDCQKIEDKTKQKLQNIDLWEKIKAIIPYQYFNKLKLMSGSISDNIKFISNLYEISNINQLENCINQKRTTLHRKSKSLQVDEINLIGWEQLIKYSASKLVVSDFEFNNNEVLIHELKTIFFNNVDTIERSKQVLSKYGIKLVVQSNPVKCAIEGVVFWQNKNPVIGLSMRYKRIDYFCFTLMHELGHLYLHLSKDKEKQFLDIENENKTDLYEKEADEFALNNIIPNSDWKEFQLNYFSPMDDEFIEFAEKMNVNPAIVLGRYQHEFNKYKMKTSIKKNIG
jgi:HTH-type transcriptional regulator / antitoxin HigA